jgi:long-subunit acyl-CoA synthetase (AMP-forming)
LIRFTGTGLPKPIGQTHNGTIKTIRDFKVNFTGFVTLPLFHAFGLYTLLRGMDYGVKTSFHNADLPITGPIVMEALKVTNAHVLFTVPYVLKLVAESKGGMDVLKQLQQIVYAGAPVPQDLGDMLVDAGVTLSNYFGMTEAGLLLSAPKDHWNWLTPVPSAAPFIRWEPEGGDIYQLVVLPGFPSLVASNRPDGAYATKDLFQRHPENPNAWRYMDRLDSTIVLSNGEKANPVLLEESLRTSRFVTEAIVFGAGKPTLGMIVVQSKNAEGMSREEFLNAIAPELEHGNSRVPAYGKVFPDAIIIKSADIKYAQTDKGTA